jgi:hypothetical protein
MLSFRMLCRVGRSTPNVSKSPVPVTLMMNALRSSETSVLTKATWYDIPEDGILNIHIFEWQERIQ